jgi:NADH-quinone oxidoreductase subunit C
VPALERLAPEEARDRVAGALGERIDESWLNFDQVDIRVPPAGWPEVAAILRDDIALKLKFFTFLSAIDRSEFGEGYEGSDLEVLCHLYSPDNAFHVNVHVPLDPDDPVCPSVTHLYGGAQWHERETAEMFGIHFTGHPNLVRLYLPEDFEGTPLRKSFKLPGRSWIKEWPGAKDPDEAAAGGR